MWIALLALLLQIAPASATPQRTFLAIGAHTGDMDLTAGALLLKQSSRGDRVVILHLTAGEGGNPKLDAKTYGEQKRREAIAVAKALGAEVIFGPYKDGELPDDDATRRYVAGVIRDVKPTHIITHWKNSMHKDHAAASAVARDAVLLASLSGWRGVRSVWYAENWEDAEGFQPYIYVNVSDVHAKWRDAVKQYEFVGGTISSFAYLDYYTALATLRGAEARKGQAVAFDVDSYGKKRVLEEVP